MPGKVKVKILAGRNLPVMDRSSDTTDAYVEIKLGNTTYKTEVYRKSLNPQWNSDWYRYELDDSELQDEPLQIRLMDHDTYSANDAIGKVYLDLNPLLLPSVMSTKSNIGSDSLPTSTGISGGATMAGWIPVFDTMHGIRGEVNLIVKVELFSDFNKFRQSSCGVQFFCSSMIPQGYHAQIVHGFVEELVVNDDPEYQWIDKIRTPRASNEARQTLFLKLSGEVQRKIGLKALDLGGNAVIGYQQCFDLEGESGIVVRGIGTAVTLIKQHDILLQNASGDQSIVCDDSSMVSASVSAVSNGFVDASASNSLKLCVAPSTPRINVLSSSSPLSPERKSQKHPETKIMPTRLGKMFPGVGAAWPKKSKCPVQVIPSHYSAKFKVDKSIRSPEYVRHFSQPCATIGHLSSRSTQSLSSGISDKILRCILEQQGNEPDSRKSSKFVRGLKAMKFTPHTKLTKTISALKARLHSYPLENFATITRSNDSSDPYWLKNVEKSPSDSRKSKIKFLKKHNRSASDSVAAVLIRSLMESNRVGLDSVVEVKESPGSSPTTPSRKQSANNLCSTSSRMNSEADCGLTESYLRLPCTEDGPELRYVDGHLISNTSSIVTSSSSSDSSSTDDDISEDYPTVAMKDTSRFFPTSSKTRDPIKLQTFSNSNSSINESVDGDENGYSVRLPKPYELPVVDTNFSSARNDYDIEVSTSQSSCDISTLNDALRQSPKYTQSVSCEYQTVSQLALDCTRNIPIVSVTCSTSGEDGFMEHECDFYGTQKNYNESSSKPVLKYKGQTTGLSNTECSTYPIMDQQKLSSYSSNIECPGDPCSAYHDSTSTADDTVVCTALLLKESNPNCTVSVNQLILPADCVAPVTSSSLLTSDNFAVPSLSKNLINVISSEEMNNNAPKAPAVGVADEFGSDFPNVSHIQKSRSASCLSSHPNKHVTNCENLQHHLKHGPCLVPISRNVGDDLAPIERQVEVPLPLPATYKACASPSRLPNTSNIYRRSSDSDLSITPKGSCRKRNSLTSSDRSSTVGSHLRPPSVRPTMNQENLDMLEYPFLTMSKYPPGFVQHLGGTVSSRSVKLLERIMNLEEPESRDLWWTELRMEVRSHARALGCNVVLGYTEQTSIYDDVCVLSASGTAAIINLESGDVINQPLIVRQYLHTKELMTTSLDRTDFEKEKNPIAGKSEDSAPMMCTKLHDASENQCDVDAASACNMCHIPYSEGSMPYAVSMQKCRICRRGKVPDVLFTTIDLPEGIPTTGKGCFLQSYVCRQKRLLKGELNAKEISDGLPFLEYELHRVLLNKLKLIGMNAIFGLKVQVAIGEKMLIGLATGTAVYLTPLPTPPVPKISSGNAWKDDKKLTEVQKTVLETIKKNREFYNLKLVCDTDSNLNGRQQTSDTDESEEEMSDMDLAAGNKDTWILEVDDSEDVDKIKTLIDPTPPEGFHIVNIENVPGLDDFEVTQNLQMFTQVWRAKISTNETHCGAFSHHINRLLQSVFFKLRRSAPCALMKVQFRVELPELDEVQLSVLGKYTCHSGMNTGAGWIIPLAYLISNGWMRSYGCNSIRSAAEYFGKSCVPGSLSKEYNTALPYENLCHLCHGSSSRYCRRDASEDYFGHTGAFRCLVEGGGDVAFVKHTTVLENTDGKRREWWARNTLTDDYELLCPDGTRSSVYEYKRCNLGKVKANAIVTRGGYAYNETEVNAFINLFIYAQQFYGRKEQDDFTFSMFSSPPPYTDLIFQDAAQLLKVIPPEKRYYSKYLGKDFMRARRIVDCYAGVGIIRIFFPLVLLPIIMTQL